MDRLLPPTIGEHRVDVEAPEAFVGVVKAHLRGHGLVTSTDGQREAYLSPSEMRAVLHGDVVRVALLRQDKRGSWEGRVLELIKRPLERVIGTLSHEGGLWLLAPEDKRLMHDVLIPKISKAQAKACEGKWVVAHLQGLPQLFAQPVGRIEEILGDVDAAGMEIEIAVRKYGVPHVFSAECEAAAKALPERVLAKDKAGRRDLTGMPLVTIDGEDARDFDDAVYCEPAVVGQGKTKTPTTNKPNGWRLVVAIADVSHYVKPHDALDQDAQTRATSVYFPRRVIAMLPEKLSNGLCSLKPAVDRLCMVCDMQINKRGQVVHYAFYPAVMHSHARLTYHEVSAILEGCDSPSAQGQRVEGFSDAQLKPHLLHLQGVYRDLLAAREARGAIDFETTETQMICDDDGRIMDIVPRVRTQAHRLIEEAMLAANVCAAQYILQAKRACLYRVHEGPTPEKRSTLQQSLRTLGLPQGLSISEAPTPSEFQAIARATKERPDAAQIHAMLLRAMQQAVYTPQNNGHFGLAYEAYTHFTSPIRRYPDLLVHRVIKSILASQAQPNEPNADHDRDDDSIDWQALGVHTSACERRADEASRDVTNWLKCKFMQAHLGESFRGTVTAATGFGLFVTLDDKYVEGLVHVTALGADYWKFDEARQELRGERTGMRYAAGSRLVVQVSRVDLGARKIDLVLSSARTPLDQQAAVTQKGLQTGRAAPKRHKRSQRGA